MDYRRAQRKTGLLISLVLLTGSSLFSTTASAGESLFSDINLFRANFVDDVRDGDLQMAGDRRSSLHLSSRSKTDGARYVSRHGRDAGGNSGVHFSWKMSW